MVVSVIITMNEKPVPEFAIFQNSRTRVSGIWSSHIGEWKQCPESEYEAIALVATILRNSPNPEAVLITIAEQLEQIQKGE